MTLSEYGHMKRIRDYVFSMPPGAERDKRLAEISEADSARLYDFDMGLLSGRIKNLKTRIKKERNETWKQRKSEAYKDYMERMERERLKEKDPVGYYLKYGGNLTAKEV